MKRLLALALAAVGCGGPVRFAGDNAAAACITAKACGLVALFDDCLQRIEQAHFPGISTTDPLAVHADCLAAAGRDCGVALGCVVGSGSCTSGPPTCEGELQVVCLNNVITELDCAQLGAHCESGSCNGPPGDCSIRCDGDTFIECGAVGGVLRFDCASVGLRCIGAAFADGVLECGRSGDCPTAGSDACDGGIFHYCDLGGPATFDCRAAGYRDCDGSGGGCLL